MKKWIGLIICMMLVLSFSAVPAKANYSGKKILDGTSPADIPVAKNKEGKLIINMRIAKELGVDLPFDFIQSANQVIE
jgi:ABC transporter substrate binding protein